MYTHYDTIIIGAGPTGLAMAQCCQNMKKNILIVDRETTIGGCHRVKRVDYGLFTEHGPRMYFGFYLNFFHLLSEMGLSKYDIFSDYAYDIANFGKSLTSYELYVIISAYFVYVFNNSYYDNIALDRFCSEQGFSKKGIDVVDRLCRFADGASIHKYSVSRFLQSFDSIMYGMLQPKAPLDKILFNHWQAYLFQRNVDFALGSEVSYIHHNEYSHKIDYIVLDGKTTIYCNKLVIAVPPKSLVNILKTQEDFEIQNCFGNINRLEMWARQTEYIEYISITYHFKEEFQLKNSKTLNFETDWGIILLNLNDTMTNVNDDTEYKFVVSIAITITDRRSQHTGKTANQCNEQELYKEVYRQLKTSAYPDLPTDYLPIISPNNYYDHNAKEWKNIDEAYFHSVGTNFIPFHSMHIRNIYNAGIHNGHSYVSYTTLESAVSNAMSLACKLYPSLRSRYYLRNYWKLCDIILIIFMLCVIFLIMYLLTHLA